MDAELNSHKYAEASNNQADGSNHIEVITQVTITHATPRFDADTTYQKLYSEIKNSDDNDDDQHKMYFVLINNGIQQTDSEVTDSDTQQTYSEIADIDTQQTYSEIGDNDTQQTYSEIADSDTQQTYSEIVDNDTQQTYSEVNDDRPSSIANKQHYDYLLIDKPRFVLNHKQAKELLIFQSGFKSEHTSCYRELFLILFASSALILLFC